MVGRETETTGYVLLGISVWTYYHYHNHYSCKFLIGLHKSVTGDAFVQRVKTACVQHQGSRCK